MPGPPLPMYAPGTAAGGLAPVRYDRPAMPGYAWPSYAAYPNYAAVTYPKQYSPTAWPYIGPFYPYPQVPLGWRRSACNGTTAGGGWTSKTSRLLLVEVEQSVVRQAFQPDSKPRRSGSGTMLGTMYPCSWSA